MKKSQKWIKLRHKIVCKVAAFLLKPYCKKAYGYRFEKIKRKKDQNYLILYNHQTSFDQFFVGVAFGSTLYYIASEDIFSIPFLSKMLKYLVAPIPIKKSVNDISAVKNCLRVVKEGGSIAIAPEGNRTYSGRTCFLKPSVSKLVKTLKLPVIFYLLEGGYGVQPRWSLKRRKGRMTGRVHKIMQPEEYMHLDTDELFALINENLFVDEHKNDGIYKSKKQAEKLERVIYICPKCGITHFKSNKQTFKCQTCDLTLVYNHHKQFEGVNVPFKNVGEWYDFQENYINRFDLTNHQGVIFEEIVEFKKIIPGQRKYNIAKSAICQMDNQHLTINYQRQTQIFKLDDIVAMAILGKNKVNFYTTTEVYQLKGDKAFNGLKYVNMYYHYQNIKNQEKEDEHRFLGI